MARMNDVGGMHGFGPVHTATDDVAFHHEWEARVFAPR
ncbi:MAG: nitrile hydratase subunit beta [Candidatus Eremiobacteraeota bacterium]|nr:nitrile hydratase subunit beta [Candidatus Eremiobacteraeota bacterium]